jgi:hypothetical protein
MMSVSEIPFRLEIFFWEIVIDFLSGLRTSLKAALLKGIALALAGFSIGLLLGLAYLRIGL